MTVNKQITIVACGLFILLGFVVNGIVSLRTGSLNENNKNKTSQINAEEIQKQEDNNILDDQETKTNSVSGTTRITIQEDKKYIVKLYNGNIAVFEKEKLNKPIKITEIPEQSLRVFDRELLKKGITVNNESELNMVLEDYGS